MRATHMDGLRGLATSIVILGHRHTTRVVNPDSLLTADNGQRKLVRIVRVLDTLSKW
jgi:hypothetical protein